MTRSFQERVREEELKRQAERKLAGCPQCGSAEWEIRTVHYPPAGGDTDVGYCYACDHEEVQE